MRQLIIMQGSSASGKSFVAEALKTHFEKMGHECLVLSTDDYWYQNEQNVYNFNPELLKRAHKWNQLRAMDAMNAKTEVVIIDNTNTTQKEANPYIFIAKGNGYDIRSISVDCQLMLAFEMNNQRPEDRKVPEEVIKKQKNRIQKLNLDL